MGPNSVVESEIRGGGVVVRGEYVTVQDEPKAGGLEAAGSWRASRCAV